MILSYEHESIIDIINNIKTNHVESDLTSHQGLQYRSSMTHARLRCPHGVDFTGTLDAEERERKTRTSRHVEGITAKCSFTVNLSWSRAGNLSAWRVGKINSCHKGHCALTQKIARLTPEQRNVLGAQMVDANLSAAQVSSF